MALIGCTKQNRAAFESTIGRTVDLVQIYCDLDSIPDPGEWLTVSQYTAAGYKVAVTYNSPKTLAQIIAGQEDARTIAIAQFLEARATHGYVGFMHESEDGGFVAADFRAAASRIYGLLATYAPSWQTMYVYVGGFRDSGTTNHQFTNGPPSNWWPTPNQPDLVGVDYYNWRGTNPATVPYADPTKLDRDVSDILQVKTGGVSQGIDSWMEFAYSLTPKPKLCFPEFGCSVLDDPAGPAERAAWIQQFADAYGGDPRIEFVNYYDLDQLSSPARVNWRISGGQEAAEAASGAAFAEIGTPVNKTFSGTVNYTTPLTIAAGKKLTFNPAATTTLIMDNRNCTSYGEIEMHPASGSVIHTVRFINVDEQNYVGAPTPTYAGPNMGLMYPTDSDVGLWVLDQGILDAIGTPKAGWNRTGTDSTWLSTDDVKSVPFRSGNYITFNDHYRSGVLGYWDKFTPATDTLQSALGPDGVTYTQEVFNLTRNVCFEGTAGHRAHVLIMTPDVTQVIKYARFENLGPRHTNPDGSTGIVRGRWSGAHFHHLMDSVGSLQEGNVVLNGTGHAYVMHDSHNVVVRDCIAYHTIDSAYWWDDEKALIDPSQPGPHQNDDYAFCADQASHFVLYDHCMAAWTYAAAGESSSSMTAFTLLPGATAPFSNGGNTITDCVAVGNQGTSSAAGYSWGEIGSGMWINSGNVAHNNAGRGVYFWQNNSNVDEVNTLVCFRNGQGGFTNGAYVNDAHYNNCVAFGNAGSGDVSTDFISAAGAHAYVAPMWRQVIQDCAFGDYGVIHHVATTPGQKAIVRNNILGSVRIDEFRSDGINFKHGEFDFIENDLEEPEEFCEQSVHPHPGNHTSTFMYNGSTAGDSAQSVFRVQRADGTAYRMQQVGASTSQWTAVSITPFAFSIPPQSLANATVGVAYSASVACANPTLGGKSPFTWTLAPGSGPLPPGLVMTDSTGSPAGATGNITGTPTSGGTYPVTFECTDQSDQHARRTINIVVTGAAVLSITTASVPAGFVGTTYSTTFVATGGTGSGKVWSLASGTLPAGLGLSAAGVLSGTPTTVGSSTFTIRVTDSGANTATRVYTLAVTNPNPTITTATPLPSGEIGVTYQVDLDATGGTLPYTWSLVSGTFQTGLSLTDAANGVISGTPTIAAVRSLVMRVTDAAARTNDKTFSLTTAAALSFFANSPPPGVVGTTYSYTFVAQDGIPPYSFSVGDVSAMPPGLTMSNDGVLSGGPTLKGTYPFRVSLVDSADVLVEIDVSISIAERDWKPRRAMALRGSSKYISVG